MQLRRLARHFGAKYKLYTAIAPRMNLTEERVNRERGQLRGETTVNSIGRHILRTNIRFLMIAITPYDMYSEVNPSLRFVFGVNGRFGNFGAAVISTARMAFSAGKKEREHRLRVMVARHIGASYFRLSKNRDRRSALYERIHSTHDLDRMTEELCPSAPGAARSC